VVMSMDPSLALQLSSEPGTVNIDVINTTATAVSGTGGAVAISAPGYINLGTVTTSNVSASNIWISGSQTPDSRKGGFGGDVYIASTRGINISGGLPTTDNALITTQGQQPGDNPREESAGVVVLYTNGDVVAGGTGVGSGDYGVIGYGQATA